MPIGASIAGAVGGMGLGTGMAVAGGLGAAGALGSAAIQSGAAKNASQAQMMLGQQALKQQQQFGQQGYQTLLDMFGQAKGILSPVIDAGGNLLKSGMDTVNPAWNTLTALLTPGANMTDTLSQIPGFKFAQDWGQKAVQNIGTTQGLGGNVLKAGADYATGKAQEGFGSIASLLQALANSGINLAGIGAGTMASSANALAGGAIDTGRAAFGGLNTLGKTMGDTLSGIGGSQASGILGSSNALASGLTGATGAAGNALMLKSLFDKFGGPGGGVAGIYSGAPQSADARNIA